MLKIGGLTPCTTIDYPGELAAVVFCQGCPWRCSYCHNQHLRETDDGAAISWDSLIGFLEKRRGLLDAVVFSGGEPTMQPDIVEAVQAVKQMGFKVGLHTAGPYPRVLHELLPYLDWVGMDIKAPFEDYELITACPDSGKAAEMSAAMIRVSGIPHQFRTTVHPLLNEEQRMEHLRSMVSGEWGSSLTEQKMVF